MLRKIGPFVFLGASLIVQGCNQENNKIPDNVSAFGSEESRLITQLKRDKVFIDYINAGEARKSYDKSIKTLETKFNAQVYRQGIDKIKSKEDYAKLLQRAGIPNAEQAMKTTFDLYITQKALFKKYPAIKNMSIRERSEVFRKATDDLKTQTTATSSKTSN